jgi:hypothetical protein
MAPSTGGLFLHTEGLVRERRWRFPILWKVWLPGLGEHFLHQGRNVRAFQRSILFPPRARDESCSNFPER